MAVHIRSRTIPPDNCDRQRTQKQKKKKKPASWTLLGNLCSLVCCGCGLDSDIFSEQIYRIRRPVYDPGPDFAISHTTQFWSILISHRNIYVPLWVAKFQEFESAEVSTFTILRRLAPCLETQAMHSRVLHYLHLQILCYCQGTTK